jgi:hypothetical protein
LKEVLFVTGLVLELVLVNPVPSVAPVRFIQSALAFTVTGLEVPTGVPEIPKLLQTFWPTVKLEEGYTTVTNSLNALPVLNDAKVQVTLFAEES